MKITSLKELRSLETGGYKFAGTFAEDDLMSFVEIKKALQEGKEPAMSKGSGDNAQVLPSTDAILSSIEDMLERMLDEIREMRAPRGSNLEAILGSIPDIDEEVVE